MKTKSFLKRLASVATLLVLALPAVALGQAPNRVDVLIGFSSPPTREDVGVVRAMGGQVRYVYSIVPAIAASVPEPALRGLAGDRRVRYVEEDAQVFTTSQTVPWGIHRVFGDSTDARIATWNSARKGDSIKVAVLDTGIASHPDLLVAGGTTFYGNNYDDGVGHGTHVAGTIAALDNSIGVVGVGPNIELYAVKVFSDSGEGYMSDVIAGLQWAANENNGHGVMDIVNMSLSGPASQTLENAVNAAYNQGAGILLVASAGNDGSHPRLSRVGYPARYNAVIAVAATTPSNTRASFSSTGPEVELSAPGVEILSTVPGDGYASYQGTSMAAPHVAGVAALIMATNPDLTAGRVREILRETAQNLGNPNHFGYGLVRANEAVTVSVPPGRPLPPAHLEAIAHDTYVTLSWDHSATATSYDIYRAAEGATYGPIASGLQTTSYLDLGLQNDTTYSYYVTAWNAVGESDPSNVVFPTPVAATSAPLAPTEFTAVALSRSQIALSWTDNANNESGFEIQRSDGSATVTFGLGPNVTSYLDSGLEPNTQYSYSLRAYNSYNSAGFSEAAGPAHATTFVQPSAAFVAQDTTTRGTWRGVYGAAGYHIVRKANGIAGPFIDGLGAAVSVSGAAIHSWADPSSDPRALQRPDSSARFADCYYQSGTISLQLSLPNMSRVSLYFVDWDTTERRQTITITDAADPNHILDSQSLLTRFDDGHYLTWNLEGDVIVKITMTGEHNAVLSGVFFDSVNGGGGGEPPPNQSPTADFSYTVDGLAVQFADRSTDSDGYISEWSWAFGDGNTSTLQDPTHTYAEAGTYNVSLTVTDDKGAIGTATRNVTVTSPPPGGVPVIETFQLSNTSNRVWARVRVDWQVAGSNLATVTLVAQFANGIQQSQTFSVSGSQASGTHEFGERGGNGEVSVTLTVQDSNGATTEIKRISL